MSPRDLPTRPAERACGERWAHGHAEGSFHATGLTTNLAPTLAQLAELHPTTLAIMHGASYHGDGSAQLRALADGYAGMLGAS
ncbi:hypothetical protein ACRCUN_02275 [Mycobacterium sp. LTG2003]